MQKKTSVKVDSKIFNPFKKLFLFIILIFQFATITKASEVASADINWTQLNTKHFFVVYDQLKPDLGLYYSKIAEQAYSNLSTVFQTLPEKITLVVNDTTDLSNGNATIFPYPLIFAYPVHVGQQDTLSESGEWAKELITHELTHIAQLYPCNGLINKILCTSFGSIVKPNNLSPLWWKEGMAVEMETQFSDQGRSRSFLQDAQVRSYVTKNILKDYDLAQANEVLVTWPYGNRPYFFGSMIMSQISKDFTPKIIGDLVLKQSEYIPYFLNSPLEDLTESDYLQIYTKAQNEYTDNAKKQLIELQKIPATEPQKINSQLLQSKSVAFSFEKNTLAFIATTDMKTEIEFYKQDATTQKLEPLHLKNRPSGNIGQIYYHPFENKIIFSKNHAVSHHENYSDLYIYDLDTQQTTDLTQAQRSRDPVFSQDGQFALFVDVRSGRTDLKQIELKTRKINVLITGVFQSRINSYAYLNTNEILYTLRLQNGDQQLYKFNLLSQNNIQIKAPQQIRFIKYKNNLLYFVSTENGIQNIYSADINKDNLINIRPLTHSLTGLLSFDIDEKNKIVFGTHISESGFFVGSNSFLPEKTILPKIENEILLRYKKIADQPFPIDTEAHDYSSLNYLYPRYWIPFISNNITNTGLLYQAMTSAADPLGTHAYTAQLNYDSFTEKMGFSFNYKNSQLSTTWLLGATQIQQLYGLNNYVKKSNYLLALTPDTFKISEDLTFSLGVITSQTEDLITSTNHLGGFFQVNFNTIDQKNNHYYPMTGYNLNTRYQYFTDQNNQTNPRLGNYSQAALSFVNYSHLFLPRDHVLMLKFDGLYTFEDVSNRFGTSNLSLPVSSEQQPLYLLRGYQAGQFSGTQMLAANFEYRFPIANLSRGSGTTPFYIKYLTGALIADGIAAKGLGYDIYKNFQNLTLTDQIFSAGLEIKLSTTIGYLLPVNFVYGLYAPLNKKYSKDDLVTALSIQISGF